MNIRMKALLGASALLLSAQTMAQVTFYEGENFRGRAVTTKRAQSDFKRSGLNDKASSVIVDSGRWEVCEDASYKGRCVVLREGSYDSLKRMGVNNRISSARKLGRNANARNDYYAPEPLAEPGYEYRRRPNERVYEARVTSVRAVLGKPEERCWVEREEVEKRGNRNVVGGVIGGVVGGVLGHQIGSGSGQDVATAGGAVAGAVIGSYVGRGRDDTSRDVRRCETVADAEPDYWDVRYTYRNVEHRAQMTAPPGRTIYVNSKGEPRQ
jgi:uncharacterized protein YcfJ